MGSKKRGEEGGGDDKWLERRTKINGCSGAGQQSDSVMSWIVQFTRWLLDTYVQREQTKEHQTLCSHVCVFTYYPSHVALYASHRECVIPLALHS